MQRINSSNPENLWIMLKYHVLVKIRKMTPENLRAYATWVGGKTIASEPYANLKTQYCIYSGVPNNLNTHLL